MSEVISNSANRLFPTFKQMWVNRKLITKYIFFGWLVPPKLLYDYVFNQRQWQIIVAEANLPNQLANEVIYIIKRTGLWDHEKKEIAVELVAHFQDGIDAGRTPDELLALFGNAKQAVKLMRRAKKRCRPLWWQAWWWFSRGLAAFLGCYILMALWQLLGRPSIKTDYLAIINSRAEAWPENQKAWPIYREAFREIDLVNMPEWFIDGDWDSEIPSMTNWPEIEKWLETKQHALSLLRDGGKRPGMGFTVWGTDAAYDPEDQRVLPELNARTSEKIGKERVAEPLEKQTLISTWLPHVHTLRQVACFLRLDSLRAAKHNDSATVMANIEAILALSRQIEEIRFLVNSLVGYAIQNIALLTVHDILAEHRDLWSDEQLKQLAHVIASHKLHPELSWDSERYAFQDILQRLYTDDGNGDGRLTQEGVEGIRAFNQMSFQLPDSSAIFFLIPKQHEVRGTHWIDQALQNSAFRTLILPTVNTLTASRKEMSDQFDKWFNFEKARLNNPLWVIEADRSKSQGNPTKQSWEAGKYWMVGIFSFFGGGLTSVVPRNAGYQEGAFVGIALELYHRKHGAWPKSLDELAPQYLPSVPIDRFTGKSLVYKIVDDRPLVYSVGADGDDDSGALPKECEGKWMEYRSATSRRAMRINTKEAGDSNGDWIIWTTLPEHHTKPAPEKHPIDDAVLRK